MRKIYKKFEYPIFNFASMLLLWMFSVSANGQSISFDRNVETLAGNTAGFIDANGESALLDNPLSVAVDASGNVYVADHDNHSIRKITPTGDVSTFAGSGSPGFSDGIGTAAEFNAPYGVAVDTVSGNVYVADRANNSIRMITPLGVVSTLAGSATAGSADDIGVLASFNSPYDVAVDGSGNVYVADFGNHLIRKINSLGEVSTLAGNVGVPNFKDGTGTAAEFSFPAGLALDASGNVYVADRVNRRIRKISSLGLVTTIAGSGAAGFADGTGTAAIFNNPNDVSVDATGNVYVADYTNHRIRQITPEGIVSTIAGETPNYVNGIGSEARFYYPTSIAADVFGNVYVADSYNNRIRKISPLSLTAFSNTNGTASDAQSFSVKGSVLAGDLIVTAPTGYEVSLAPGTGYSNTVSLSPVTGTVYATLVYVRLAAAAPVGINAGNIQLTSTDITAKSLAVTGTTIARVDQTITFDPLTTPQTFGAGTFTLSATSTSNLTVTFTSSNTAVATVSGNTVTIVGAGSADITAVQAGDVTYNPAPDVVQTLLIEKADQTISFTAFASTTFGDAAIALTSNASSGLPITYTSDNTAVATVSGNIVTIVGVGEANITATQAGNTNFNSAADVMNTLTVVKADQTIPFTAFTTKTYGDPAVTLTANASSGLPIVYTSDNTAVASITDNILTIVGAGTANISATLAGNANYNAAVDVAHQLTVNKAAQTITFNALPAKAVGDPDFTLTATVSSNLPITYSSSVTSVATVTGNSVQILAAGITDIIATQAGDDNHEAAQTKFQTLNVTAATGLRSLTIIESRSYPNPVSEVLHIEPKQRLNGDVSMTLSNMQGKIVFSTKTQGGKETYTVDLSTLESGVYMLELSNGTQVISQRIVKK